jgi:toxin HigB-1
MKVEFSDPKLSLIETDAAAQTGLPIAVINAFRDKFVVIRAAPDERTLRNWKSLHYEKLEGFKDGRRSIRLNRQYRVVFTIKTECSPNEITVLSVEDYH